MQTRSNDEKAKKESTPEGVPENTTSNPSSGLWVMLLLLIPLASCLVYGYLTR